MTTADEQERLDPDEDQVLWPDDCDDNDSSIGAKATWYLDEDGDGFGGESTTEACSPPEGYQADGGDCDDTNTAINPGAVEICDSVNNDEDCSGSADDGDDAVDTSTLQEWFRDSDGDGYGDAGVSTLACDQPEGHVADATDCNDQASNANPGIKDEICGDQTDNDCDTLSSVVEECGPVGSVNLTTANAILLGEDADDHAGWAVSIAGDVNGDSRLDVLIGAYGNDAGSTNAGVAYLMLGPIPGDSELYGAHATFVGAEEGDRAGWSVAGAGDVNNDDADDIFLGAYLNDDAGGDAGAAYVIFGPTTGSINVSSADVTFTGADASDSAGWSLASGDANGDDNSDLLIGANLANPHSYTSGAVYLLTGPATGTISLEDADATFSSTSTLEYVGWTIAFMDANSDGDGDILIGAQRGDQGGEDAGVVYLVHGPVSGDVDLIDAHATLTGESAGDYAAEVSVGDINDDGFDDILVGAYKNDQGGKDAGAAYLQLGPVTGSISLTKSNATFVGATAGDNAGWSVLFAGDIDGDSHGDLVIGAPGESTGGPSSGTSYVIHGPVSGTVALSAVGTVLIGENNGGRSGSNLAAGDINNNGVADILIGAHAHNEGGSGAGAVYVVYGGAGL